MQHPRVDKRAWVALVIICFVYFFGLGWMPLAGPDEPRYAEVAREMFARGDPITPTLGGHTWFEKPALLYWMMMVSYRLFGVSEFAARFGPACAGLLASLAIAALGWRLEKVTALSGLGWLSSIVTATSLGMLVFSRGASFDMPLTASVTLALCGFFLFDLDERERKRILYLGVFYVAIGVGLLAKGLVGLIIPCGVVLIYLWLQGRLRDVVELRLWWGVPLACLVAASWYGPVIARHGWIFIDQFFIQHHFARYLSNKYHHPQPFYFYLPVIALLSLPWTPFLIAEIAAFRRMNWRAADVISRARIFAFVWLMVPVIFFSFSGSKLPGYVLPSLPGAALLIGLGLRCGMDRELFGRWNVKIVGASFILLGLGGAAYAIHREHLAALDVGPVAVTSVLAGIYLCRRSRVAWREVAAIGSAVALSIVLIVACALETAASHHSVRDLLARAAAVGYDRMPILHLHTIERTAEFYGAGRLVYDARGEPLKLESVSQVADWARRFGGPVLVIVPVEHAHQLFEARTLGVERIGDNGAVALFVVRALS